ncbi:MAG TPA: SHOCT domain-containing protein [Thiolapillus brandeum]|uniref:SHOCT domain-containing protein n=1 Tax=Thiolapillus brandeum TaxID=1076588 RepID=A0A831NXM7_9GAMM|nr:SHOCT domain-containing protein [Thiolapillus brandeum]
MYEGHWFGFGGGFMWLFWILLIVVVLWAVKAAVRGGASSDESTTALDILKQRYARGEIDREEFEQKRKDLM